MSPAGLPVFAAAYSAVVALPGAAVTALVARVLARGPRGAPAFVAGIAVGSLAWFTIAATGLAALAGTFSSLLLVVRYAGVAYLLYLAWKLWNTPARAVEEATDASPESGGRLFLAGLAINLGTPKAVVFFLALLPTVVDLDALGLIGFSKLCAVIVAIITGVFAAYATAAARAPLPDLAAGYPDGEPGQRRHHGRGCGGDCGTLKPARVRPEILPQGQGSPSNDRTPLAKSANPLHRSPRCRVGNFWPR